MSNEQWGPPPTYGQQAGMGHPPQYGQYPPAPDNYKEPTGWMPWLEVWIRPRKVVRSFLDSSNPTRYMILIAWFAGMFSVLDRASEKSALDNMPALALLPLVVIGGFLGGLLALYLGGALFKWVGSWLGGTGTHEDMRVAVTRGYNTLSIIIGLLWIPNLLLAGGDMFTEATPRLDNHIFLSLSLLVITLVELALIIWGFVVGLHAIGEAHRFSAWKSLLAAFIIIIMVLILIAIIALLIGIGVGITSAV